jgi:alkylation response protein AidB-like acyl-CoA dehydrogenase
MSAAGTIFPLTRGGSFLIEECAPSEVFTAEDLSDQHLAIARTVDEFWGREVEPNLPAIRRQEPGVVRGVLQKAATVGLTAIGIPEEFGGMELDLASEVIATEHLGRDGSYSGWHSGHTGIGTLPVLYFGTEQQKRKYLPKLASTEMLGAYALTEPQAGSDALAARTRADLSPDGKFYLLNGQKMWITNGGEADLFTVFAKVGGEHFAAFLVERGFGVKSGAEEHKMGLKGSSTTALYFDNVHVPVENVLGEIGRGHIIALNVLNVGRLKLGAGAMGAAKSTVAVSLAYAKERKAFGSSIAEFGAIRHKLAEMAIRVFAAESIIWRVVGQIDSRLEDFSWSRPDASETILRAVEEYAAECSMVKVYASEALGYVVDEGVQIHGGYGYHQDYAVERAYRDARIHRIFEGTNEINRLVICGMLLKRAARGQLALMPAIEKLQVDALNSGATHIGQLCGAGEDRRLVANAKKIGLLSIGVAQEKYSGSLEKQQEVVMHLADILTETFAMESVFLRTCKLSASGRETVSGAMCSVFLRDAMGRIELAARNVLGACLGGEALNANMMLLRRLAGYEPVDSVALRRRVAGRLLARERYAV